MENNVVIPNKFKTFLSKLGKSGIWAISLLFTILISSLFASLIQSDWGKVEVSTVVFNARDDQKVAYDLYKPKKVTEDEKAPLLIVIPGFQRSRETQGHLALEFARRGYVVINIDPYSQGDSTSSRGLQGSAIATVEGYGSFDLINYIYDNPEVYPYVDKTRIGVTGHSAGGNDYSAVINKTSGFDKEEKVRAFKTQVANLILKFRKDHPNAHIMWTMTAGSLNGNAASQVIAQFSESDQQYLHVVVIEDVGSNRDLAGANNHASYTTHQRSAQTLVNELKKYL
ncbi:MAG: acetylxylan esterase [Bacilli bacterium]|nr:acetylxylan esterase [Bacilli bacterium]